MSNKEFNERPFVAGEVVGVRSFKVDKLGRLIGVTTPSVFKPGVNVATHGGELRSTAMREIDAMSAALQAAFGSGVRRSTTSPAKSNTHNVAALNCSCGYYAYFDGRNTFHADGQVEALVKGYGTVTVGSRGFRAEKAELVALVDRSQARSARDSVTRLGCWLGNHDLFTPVTTSALIAAGIAVMATCAHSPLWWLFGFGAAMSVIGFALFVLGCICIGKELPRSARIDLVRRNYPDVPVYGSLRAAVKAHPLTVPPEPPAPSPTDEDFWTRETTS